MKWSALCMKMLEENAWFPTNIISSSKNGTVDIIAIRKGVVIWIECKEGNDTPSYLQKRFRKKIIENGGNHILAEKEKFTDFLNQIK